MLWDSTNCMTGATVHVAGENGYIKQVISIDDESKTITKAHLIDGKVYCNNAGEIATETRKVDAIYPVFAGSPFPLMFLCFDYANG